MWTQKICQNKKKTSSNEKFISEVKISEYIYLIFRSFK